MMYLDDDMGVHTEADLHVCKTVSNAVGQHLILGGFVQKKEKSMLSPFNS